MAKRKSRKKAEKELGAIRKGVAALTKKNKLKAKPKVKKAVPRKPKSIELIVGEYGSQKELNAMLKKAGFNLGKPMSCRRLRKSRFLYRQEK